MKTQELLKLSRKNNCEVSRNSSRHDIWFSPVTGKQFAVPRRKAEIPIGTLNNVLKDAGRQADIRNPLRYLLITK